MTTRRDFLRAAAALPVGIGTAGAALRHPGQAEATRAPIRGPTVQLTEYERILAMNNLFDILGRPRSWSVVQQGFLPFAPERVLILEPWVLERPADRWRDEQRRILERMQRDAAAESPSCMNGYRRRVAESGISSEKLGLILWLTNELTRYYAAPEAWHEWAYNMTFREALGTTAIGRHFAMPHQFQYDAANYRATPIKTVNAGLDWWMILIPNGTNHWESLDELPVHAMFLYIVSGPHSAGPGDQLRRLELGSRVERLFSWDVPNAFVELSQMDRVSAARQMNRHFVCAADDRPQARK
jgi:hypothetical protein